ncbi:MAG: hypothetical protein JNL88_02025 [Bacteroidia bacterium]|nr:hypothetical protein [Bacteroidia bacterium]
MKVYRVLARVCVCFLLSTWLLFLLPVQSLAQTKKIDAFKRDLSKAGSKDSMGILLNLLLEKNSMPGDSIRKFVDLAEGLAGRNTSPEVRYLLNFYKVIVAQNEASSDQAISTCDSNIRAIENAALGPEVLLRFLQLKASLLVRKGLYEEALQAYFRVLEEAERVNNMDYQIAGRNGVGWVYMEKSEWRTAIDWFKKALATTEDLKILDKFTIVMTNIAATYNSIHENDSALDFVDRAITIALKTEDLRSVANGYAIKADILIDLNRKSEAAVAMKEALNVRKKIGDIYYIISDIFQLGLFHASTGDCQNGILISKEGIDLVNKYKVDSKRILLYEALAANYKACNDMESYAGVLERMITWKDSAAKAVSENALAEMSAKYNLQAKEQQIIRQELLLSRRNYIIYGSLVLFLLIGVIGVQYFAQYKSNQERKSMMDMARARDDERLRIAADLHDSIGSQLSFISRKLEIILSKKSEDVNPLSDFMNEMDANIRKTISDLRETIWTMKKERIDFSELADRLKLFAQQLLSETDVKLHISESHEAVVSFSSIESINFYRIVQEAINNAFRHARAKNITIRFVSSDEKGWRIEINDDGVGFDTKEVFEEHYGHENMKYRAKNMNVHLVVSSTAMSGTSVILSNRRVV